MSNITTFQDLVIMLDAFWRQEGCIVMQPYDIEVGAGTFHPATFLKAIGPEPWRSAHVQASRRPTDGRYGEHPNRGQHFYQYQVSLKPSPADFQQLYLDSLQAIGIDISSHDIRFVEDNWESPALGAWGLGWEVWLNGMEITQFTYFQQVGGLECNPVMGELAYGIERIALHLQNANHINDLIWANGTEGTITYGDIYKQNEQEMSAYNFKVADISILFTHFDQWEKECKRILHMNLPLPAYDMLLKSSHAFNMLDARNAISATERQRYILRIRNLSRQVAEKYYETRKKLGFPLLKTLPRVI